MRKILILLVVIYQKLLSPDKGILPRVLGRTRQVCIFYPTCSEYAKEALEIHGSVKGTALAVRRVLRCNPFNEPGIDEVPVKKA